MSQAKINAMIDQLFDDFTENNFNIDNMSVPGHFSNKQKSCINFAFN